MPERRLVLAGTGSGVGKTTLTIGIMSALQKKGYTVQGFKCGPDYIDPTYHTAVTGRVSRNLDSWMFTENSLKEILSRAKEGADISIIEGVMGFYDGKDPESNKGSAADISVITNSPVLLVVNCAAMARSAAAIVKGFQCLWDKPNIVGVIANQVGSEGHFNIVKAAIEKECGVPVLGYVPKKTELKIPSRHLGLVPAIERGELNSFFDMLGEQMLETIDIDRIYRLSETTKLPSTEPFIYKARRNRNVKIAVARDAAFDFYYQENLEMLEANGAELIYFSPLKGENVPAAHGLYLGGGFPEEYADILASREEGKTSILQAIESGMPTLAECGGYMYLHEKLVTTAGKTYPMAGLIPGTIKMQTTLAALGYREITGLEGNFLVGTDEVAKGHEFHYSTLEGHMEDRFAYITKGRRGEKKEGYLQENLVAGYTHLHFASNPALAANWVEACFQYKSTKAVL